MDSILQEAPASGAIDPQTAAQPASDGLTLDQMRVGERYRDKSGDVFTLIDKLSARRILVRYAGFQIETRLRFIGPVTQADDDPAQTAEEAPADRAIDPQAMVVGERYRDKDSLAFKFMGWQGLPGRGFVNIVYDLRGYQASARLSDITPIMPIAEPAGTRAAGEPELARRYREAGTDVDDLVIGRIYCDKHGRVFRLLDVSRINGSISLLMAMLGGDGATREPLVSLAPIRQANLGMAKLGQEKLGPAKLGMPRPDAQRARLMVGGRYRAANGEAFRVMAIKGADVEVQFAGDDHAETHKRRRLGDCQPIANDAPDYVPPSRTTTRPGMPPRGGQDPDFDFIAWRGQAIADAIMRHAPLAAMIAFAVCITIVTGWAVLEAGR